VVIFRIRGVLTSIINDTSRNLEIFSGLLTFFFGPLYLEIRLNQLIRLHVSQVGSISEGRQETWPLGADKWHPL